MGIGISIIDDAIDIGEDIIKGLKEIGDEAVEFFEEEFLEPIEKLLEDAEEVFKEFGETLAGVYEDFGNVVLELIEGMGKALEKAWTFTVEGLEELWGDVCDIADQAWDDICEYSLTAWNFLEEQVERAADWLEKHANLVIDFIIEEAIPYLLTIVKFVVNVIVAVVAVLLLPFCYLWKEITEEDEWTVIEGIARHQSRMMDEFNVEQLPLHEKYVVFSDVHMYPPGSLDNFNNAGNSQIYLSALDYYSRNDYHLIENGDIEDFWLREGRSEKKMADALSEQLPWPFYSDMFKDRSYMSLLQMRAYDIFMSNARVYAKIRTEFHDKGKYTRLIGNHDDAWDKSDMDSFIQTIYPGIQVFDYCTLEVKPYTASVVIAHGHQGDIFNTPLCSFAGKAITRVVSSFHELTFRELNPFIKKKSWWKDKWDNNGFANMLQDMDLLQQRSLSEKDLYKGLRDAFPIDQPHLILGHTHHPKDDAGVYDYYSTWKEYSNSGTVGMWQEIIFGLEINYPNIDVIVWRKGGGWGISAQRYVLKSHRILTEDIFVSHYLKPE